MEGTSRDGAWARKKALDTVIEAGAGNIRDRKPYVIVEPSLARRPYLFAGNRFFGYFEQKGIPKMYVKPEWGP